MIETFRRKRFPNAELQNLYNAIDARNAEITDIKAEVEAAVREARIEEVSKFPADSLYAQKYKRERLACLKEKA